MQIKKFSATNTQLALQEVKKVLGPDAIVLHVEEKKDTNTRKKIVEVTAAIDEEYQKEKDRWTPTYNHNQFQSASSFQKRKDHETHSKPNFSHQDRDALVTYKKPEYRAKNNSASFSEIQEVRDQLQSLSLLIRDNGYPELPPAFLDVYAHLLDIGVDRKFATNLLKDVDKRLSKEAKKSRNYIYKEVIHSLENFISSINNEKKIKENAQSLRVLVGPTGMGKTTCIAKLAAHDKIYHNLNVGFISIDTYRIAAVEQLRTYAQITRIPLEIAYTPSDMEAAIHNLSDSDVIYIDTPGRSPKNTKALKEIAEFFRRYSNLDIHLVISMNSKNEDIWETIDRFSIFPMNHLLFTKLDETNSVGTILSVLNHAKRPISYISTGQNVPEDITKPSVESLAEMMMGAKYL